MLSTCYYLLLFLVFVDQGFCQSLTSDPWKGILDLERLPDYISSGEECLRECKPNQPRLCYYRFIAENFMSNGQGCDSCYPDANNTLTHHCQCVLGDGFERSTMAINRHIPGPSIQVCKGDSVVVDVSNRLLGQDLTIHWHGIFQRNTQYYDGVPFVTQCPILESTTFRYEWTAAEAGTQFWHSHSGIHEINGIYGSLIVREPAQDEVHIRRYHTDSYDHVIIISEWMHELAEERFPGRRVNGTGQVPETFLINGKGLPYSAPVGTSPIEIFKVVPGYRHRFRLINAFATVCPGALTIQGHRLKVIATDGHPVEPVLVDTIVSFTGERYDFILEANQTIGAYWIQLQGLGSCGRNQVLQVAQIVYQNFRGSPRRFNRPTYVDRLPQGVVLNPFDVNCNNRRQSSRAICVDKLRSVKRVPQKITKRYVDYKLYLSFVFKNINATMYKDNNYEHYLIATNNRHVQSLINGISFTSPASPMLSQYNDVLMNSYICNTMDRKRCTQNFGCECVHILDFPLGSLIEILVIDEAQITNLSHPFHLHGQEFYVMHMSVPPQNPNGTLDVPYLIWLDRHGKLGRNFHQPPGKDTLAVPRSGVIIIRFHATNPGFWLLHCHFNYHVVIGMSLVIRIGNMRDLPPIPENFPKCGDHIPPMFPSIYPGARSRPRHPSYNDFHSNHHFDDENDNQSDSSSCSG